MIVVFVHETLLFYDGYSEEEVGKIWGRNFLRALTAANSGIV